MNRPPNDHVDTDSRAGHGRTEHLGRESGVAAIPRNRRGMDRWSAADAFLNPARSRANLDVRGDTLVHALAHNGTSVTGVETSQGSFYASTVIASGGVFETPRLLMRSGLDRPGLGENLSDHLMVPVRLEHRGDLREVDEPTLQTMLQYATGQARPGVHDMQIFPAWTKNGSALVLYVVLQTMANRGRVTRDLVEWPFAQDSTNVATLRLGLEHGLELAATAPLSELAQPVPQLLQEDLTSWIAAEHGNWGHGCGTCALGIHLDNRGEYADLAGLHVADASMIPTVPSVNPNLTVMAAALVLASKL